MSERQQPIPYEGPREKVPFDYKAELETFQALLDEVSRCFDSRPPMRDYLIVHLDGLRDRHSAMEDIWERWKPDERSKTGRVARIAELLVLARPQLEALYVLLALVDDYEKFFALYTHESWWNAVLVCEYRRRWRGSAASEDAWFAREALRLSMLADKYGISTSRQAELQGKAREDPAFQQVKAPKFPTPGELTNEKQHTFRNSHLKRLADLLYPHYKHACDAVHSGARHTHLKAAIADTDGQVSGEFRGSVLNQLILDSIGVSMVAMLTGTTLIVTTSNRNLIDVRMRLIRTWEAWVPGIDLARILWDNWSRVQLNVLG